VFKRRQPNASTDLNVVQPVPRYLHFMDAAKITDAALETMAEVGLDRLTMRAVAARLGVHVGGLYYYLPDKTTLLRSMADQICLQITEALAPTGDWRLDALDLCHTTRRTLLERRDATRVFAQSPVVASVGALGLIERLLELLATGIKPDRVAAAADTMLSYVTGFTLQEQIGTDIEPLDPRLIANGPALFPRMFAALGCDPEVTFATALQAILAGFESPAPLAPTPH
jgi:TetR/AcrR family transcriptional regulator, tetracycline repressor protein